MSIRKLFALEGLDEVIAADDEAIAEVADEVTEDVAEVEAAEEAGEAVDETLAVIDESEEVGETVDNMADAVEDAVEEGGLSEPAAEAVRVAVEHFKARVGLPKNLTRGFPAMEGFKEVGTKRVDTTKAALEDLKETAAKIWEAVKAAFSQAIEWLKKQVAMLMDASVKYGEKAKKLGEAAKTLHGKKANGANVSGDFKAILFAGGAVDVKAGLGEHIQAMDEILKGQTLMAEKGKPVLEALVASAGTDAFKADEALGLFKLAAVGTEGKGGEGVKSYELKLPFGGKSFVSVIPDTLDKVGAVKFGVETTDGFKGRDAGDVPAADADDVVGIAALVEKHLAGYKSIDASIKDLDSAQKGILGKARSIKGEDDKAKQVAAAGAAAKAYVRGVVTGVRQVRGYDISVCAASLKYGAASLKALGGAKPMSKSREVATA